MKSLEEDILGPSTKFNNPIPTTVSCSSVEDNRTVSTSMSQSELVTERLDTDALIFQDEKSCTRVNTPLPSSETLVLFRPEDEQNLSSLHCLIRKKIEVFIATSVDVSAPSPGRKHSIKAGQVGLRCIDCRHIAARDRTRRAVCYPTSVKRIYNCVSDMKLEHFSKCRCMPFEDRKIFDNLHALSRKRKNAVNENDVTQSEKSIIRCTAQYYTDSAVKHDLMDGDDNTVIVRSRQAQDSAHLSDANTLQKSNSSSTLCSTHVIHLDNIETNESHVTMSQPQLLTQEDEVICRVDHSPNTYILQPDYFLKPTNSNGIWMDGSGREMLLMSCPLDDKVLNPLHCFVRRNIEVFLATNVDIVAPAPGRKHRIVAGQVGIRCIHCSVLPIKDRVKRAVSFPPTVASIYHCISNMKFDHFSACRGIPPTLRSHFNLLKESSCSGSSKHTYRVDFECRTDVRQEGIERCVMNSTARYYFDSAIRDLGLMDTATGIRFREGYSPLERLEKERQHRLASAENIAQVNGKVNSAINTPNLVHNKDTRASTTNHKGFDETNRIPHGMSVLMFVATRQNMIGRDLNQSVADFSYT